MCLTRKGRIVLTGDKLVLGNVASFYTIFRFFERKISIVFWNKLCVSTNFIILGATDQKLWVFENFRRSLGSLGSQNTFVFGA
jgi:hypothetical protein